MSSARRLSRRRGPVGTSDNVLGAVHGDNGSGTAERGRSRTRGSSRRARNAGANARDNTRVPTDAVDSNVETNAQTVKINEGLKEIRELVSGSKKLNESVINELIPKQRVGLRRSASLASARRGVATADDNAQALDEAFNIIATHDDRLKAMDSKLDAVLKGLDVLVKNQTSLKDAASQRGNGAAGVSVGQQPRRQGQAEVVAGAEGEQGEGEGERQRSAGEPRPGQQQQPQQQPRATGAGQTERRERTDGTGRGGHSPRDVMLQRQREERGPFMVVFNLPEEQRIMPERQRVKDMEDITYLVSYIDETAAEEEGLKLSENIIDVIRLGRKN